LECNLSFAEIHGFVNVKEVIGLDISQLNPNDWADLIHHLKSEYKIQGYQSWQMRPDGKEIHVVANVIGIFNDSKELLQVKGYVYDDTERKQAEDDLIKSEEKYHLLFDEDLTGDFIATPEGHIKECNPAFARIYGFNNCEMAQEWNISQSNPFDWPYMVTRLRNEGKIQSFQSWQRRSDAMRIHVVANMIGIFNDSGELVQVKGYVFDDTERKQAEEELERGRNQITGILDSVRDGFIALNNFWDIIYANPCAGEYAGVDVDDLLGQNLWQRFPELDGTIYEKKFRKAMNDHEIQHFEERGIHKTDQWFSISVYPSDDGISVYWRDIPKLKTQEN
jgi:PAS domain S-box-containing protein